MATERLLTVKCLHTRYEPELLFVVVEDNTYLHKPPADKEPFAHRHEEETAREWPASAGEP
jgi:hypothetical protein